MSRRCVGIGCGLRRVLFRVSVVVISRCSGVFCWFVQGVLVQIVQIGVRFEGVGFLEVQTGCFCCVVRGRVVSVFVLVLLFWRQLGSIIIKCRFFRFSSRGYVGYVDFIFTVSVRVQVDGSCFLFRRSGVQRGSSGSIVVVFSGASWRFFLGSYRVFAWGGRVRGQVFVRTACFFGC